jgi:hypothetical protein
MNPPKINQMKSEDRINDYETSPAGRLRFQRHNRKQLYIFGQNRTHIQSLERSEEKLFFVATTRIWKNSSA